MGTGGQPLQGQEQLAVQEEEWGALRTSDCILSSAWQSAAQQEETEASS